MKMRQLILDIHLLENDLRDFPIPTLPTVLFKGKMIFVGDDIKPAILAAKYLAGHIGMDVKSLENLNQSDSQCNNRS